MSDPTPAGTQRPSHVPLSSTLVNLITSPGEAFAPLVDQPVKHSRWVLPLAGMFLLMTAIVYLMFTHPTFHQQMQDAQMAGLDKAVQDGKMTREQADMAAERMGGTNPIFIVIGAVFGGIFIALVYVVGSLFLWLAAKYALASPAGYQKHLEIYGTASWIGIMGGIITLLMMLALNSMYATPSAGLAVYTSFDPANKMHTLLRSLDVFGAWQAVVVGIGISKIAGKGSGAGIGLALVLWLIWIAVSVSLGLAR